MTDPSGWRDAMPEFDGIAASTGHDAIRLALELLQKQGDGEPTAAEIDACCRGSRDGLFLWCAQTFRFLVVTRDLADALAHYLQTAGTRRCVEIGAGRGELATALTRRGIPCAATDDQSWAIRPRATGAVYGSHVLPLSHLAALERLLPDSVLSAWMPHHADWTAAFRAAPSVSRYIMIGTGPDGAVATQAAWQAHDGWTGRPLLTAEAGARCRLDSLLGTPFARLCTRVVAFERG